MTDESIAREFGAHYRELSAAADALDAAQRAALLQGLRQLIAAMPAATHFIHDRESP